MLEGMLYLGNTQMCCSDFMDCYLLVHCWWTVTYQIDCIFLYDYIQVSTSFFKKISSTFCYFSPLPPSAALGLFWLSWLKFLHMFCCVAYFIISVLIYLYARLNSNLFVINYALLIWFDMLMLHFLILSIAVSRC